MQDRIFNKYSIIGLVFILLSFLFIPTTYAETTGYKVSGYIMPDFDFSVDEAAIVKAGFKVELTGIANMSCETDANGYFEFTNVPKTYTPGIPSSTQPYTVTITKPNYLTRTLKNVAICGDSVLCIQDKAIDLWVGDMMVNNLQDNVINMADILEIAKYFNSVSGDGKYDDNHDLNKDKAINMNDIMIAVKHFNKITSDYPAIDIKTGNVIYCTTAAEIQNALTNAQPGDRIVVKSGTYTGSWINSSFFYSGNEGTQSKPITIESEDPQNPAVLQGLSTSSGYVLYITGDYWQIRNLKVSTGQKGIMLDHSNNSIIYGCEVFNVGHEGIHFRDGSSNGLIQSCKVHDTGKLSASFGEGIYIGSDNGKWSTYNKDCNNNRVFGSTLGPNITAEHVDIKEGTVGTIIESCTMDGTGISGQNYADSFIDAKGNDAIIRNNQCYRNNNSIIVDAFQVHQQLSGWGLNNDFYGNTVNLDDAAAYIVNAPAGSARASNNTRVPAGNTYKGNVTVY